jgi:hypothetical protein
VNPTPGPFAPSERRAAPRDCDERELTVFEPSHANDFIGDPARVASNPRASTIGFKHFPARADGNSEPSIATVCSRRQCRDDGGTRLRSSIGRGCNETC